MPNAREILDLALAQSALDFSCSPAQLLDGQDHVTLFAPREGVSRYLPQPTAARLISYGGGVVATVANEELRPPLENYLRRCDEAYYAFSTPQLLELDAALRPLGYGVKFAGEYWLPQPQQMKALPCAYELRVLEPQDFAGLYVPQWSHALCADRPQLDRLGVGAYDGETLVGFAACSADCAELWQIGVDVLPAYRRQGIAAAVTSRLAQEIFARGKVPFYCCAWSNLASAKNAIRCGFSPAWVLLEAVPQAER